MALEMELSNHRGICDKCGEEEWLYHRGEKHYCGYCLQDMELNQQK